MTTTQQSPTTHANEQNPTEQSPTTRTEPHRPTVPEGKGVSFSRLLRTELRKTINTRGGRWLLLIIVILTAVAMGLVMWLMRDQGAPLSALLAAAVLPQGVLLPVLGIMTAASEWSQRTALVTFTQEPRRLRVMLAKLVAATILGLTVLAITLGLAALAHVASAGLGSDQVNLTEAPGHFLLGLTALQVSYVLMGVAFGAMFLHVPLAVAAFFVLPVVMNLLSNTVTWIGERAAWIDQSFAAIPFSAPDPAPTAEHWQQLGTTSLIWVAVPLALGLWRVARREIK